MIKATVLGLEKKQTPFDKNNKYYKNGVDDSYGEKQKLLIKNSVTAKTSSSIMCQYVIGGGYGENDNLIVDDDKKLDLYNLASRHIKSKVEQRGVFFHVKYNANFEKDSISVIPFEDCRVGKKDDQDYNGKILISKDFKDKTVKVEVLDVYNPDQAVIESQVRTASKNKKGALTQSDWNKYKGQVWFVNDDYEYIYPDSRIDAVQKDCDSEAQASVYKNGSLRKGDFGKTVFITPPLIDDDIKKHITDNDGKSILNPAYKQAETERDAFKNTVESFFGAENTGNGILLETEYSGEDLENAFIIKNYQSNINDKLFEYTEKSTRRNILFAFNNLPVMLVEPSEGVFSSSGETFLQAQIMYWRNNKHERNQVESVLTELLTNFKGEDYVINTEPLLPVTTTQNNDNNTLDR